jgi:hypothetical protein
MRSGYRIDPGVTGYSHILGCVAQRFVFPAPLVERAAIEAMTDMKMHSVRRSVKGPPHGLKLGKDKDKDKRKDQDKGGDPGAPPGMVVLDGLLYDGRLICVEIEPQGGATGVRVRIDVYGDEPMSKVLLDRMGVRLATLPQAVNPPFETRNLSDSILHRGMQVEGYRGAPLR